MKMLLNCFTCVAMVVAICVSSAQVQATDTVWDATVLTGDWGNGANWDHGHSPDATNRGSINSSFLEGPLEVNINAPAEALELFVNDVLGPEVTLNVNSSLIVGRNSFGSSLFVSRNNTANKATININGAAGGSLWVGDPDALPTDVNYRQGTFVFSGESEWNITGGADVTMGVLRGNSASPLDFNIADDSTVRISFLRTFSPVDTIDIIGPDATFIVDMTEFPFGDAALHVSYLQNWLTNGNTDTTALTSGTRIRGFEADGVTQTELFMFPLDGSNLENGVYFSTVPEPTTVALLGLGLIGFATARRRRS